MGAVLLLLAGAVCVRRGVDGWPGATSPGAGALFAVLLGLVFVAGRRSGADGGRTAHPPGVVRALLVGTAGAALLVAGPVLVELLDPVADGGFGLDAPSLPLAWFPGWAVVVTAVAITEELVLRGTLWAALERAGARPAVVLAVTTIAFAALHVPFYGWASVPVNLAAGLVLGAVRRGTGTLIAPATTHTLADLAGWFLV